MVPSLHASSSQVKCRDGGADRRTGICAFCPENRGRCQEPAAAGSGSVCLNSKKGPANRTPSEEEKTAGASVVILADLPKPPAGEGYGDVIYSTREKGERLRKLRQQP